MRTTETDSRQLVSSSLSRALVPRLTIVRHPDPGLVGVGAAVSRETVLGRTSTFLAGALDHRRVSREHARIRNVKATLTVEDLGSRNGTSVDGETIEGEARLDDGAIVGIGPVLLLAHRAPRYVRAKPHPRLWSVSHAMAEVVEQLERAAKESGNVVLMGETGVGKEVAAQALHDASGRAGEMLAVNCAELSDGVLQSELFGHERGAFSGANATKVGLIEAAERGTLFLDELASASPALQAALLRVLQDGKVRRVGATSSKETDVRFVAAVLEGEGSLREDLWFRLARRRIEIPPLRERPEDIAFLAQRFAEREVGEPVRLGRQLAMQMLRHDWPGNVRELQSTVERLVADYPPARVDDVLELETTNERLFTTRRPSLRDDTVKAEPSQSKVKRPSKDRLQALLSDHEGQVASVARALGVPRKSVYRWLKAMEIDPDGYRVE